MMSGGSHYKLERRDDGRSGEQIGIEVVDGEGVDRKGRFHPLKILH